MQGKFYNLEIEVEKSDGEVGYRLIKTGNPDAGRETVRPVSGFLLLRYLFGFDRRLLV